MQDISSTIRSILSTPPPPVSPRPKRHFSVTMKVTEFVEKTYSITKEIEAYDEPEYLEVENDEELQNEALKSVPDEAQTSLEATVDIDLVDESATEEWDKLYDGRYNDDGVPVCSFCSEVLTEAPASEDTDDNSWRCKDCA